MSAQDMRHDRKHDTDKNQEESGGIKVDPNTTALLKPLIRFVIES